MDITCKLVAAYVAIRSIVPHATSQALQSAVESSTPVSSFPRSQEGLYLYENLQISPFEGGIFHQSPSLLVSFSSVPQFLWPCVFSIADAYGASSSATYAETFVDKSYSPSVVALVYLSNPFSLGSSLAQSTNVITNALICGSIGAAVKKRTGLSSISLASATTSGWYPLYLSPSILGLNRISAPSNTASMINLIDIYLAGCASFLGIAFLPSLSWQFLTNQFGTLFLSKDLTQPNIGLWWYFFIEMFDFFRPFFLGAFQSFILAFPIPSVIRFSKQPSFTLATMIGLLAVFKPYPEASDTGLFLASTILNRPVSESMEYTFIEASGLLYVSVLGPAFYYSWIFVGSGNANFYYAITSVYAVTLILVLADSTWAAIRIDYGAGKSVKLVQL